MREPLRRADFLLRPLTLIDGQMVLAWRNSDRVHEAMYSDRRIAQDEHDTWMQEVTSSDRFDYSIFEHHHRPIGLVGVSDMDRGDRRCTWGYYLGVDDAVTGSGRAMAWFAIERIFGPLGMRKLCGETFTRNERSVRLHEAMGFRREGHLIAHRFKDGAYQDVDVFALFADDWRSRSAAIAAEVFVGEPV